MKQSKNILNIDNRLNDPKPNDHGYTFYNLQPRKCRRNVNQELPPNNKGKSPPGCS